MSLLLSVSKTEEKLERMHTCPSIEGSYVSQWSSKTWETIPFAFGVTHSLFTKVLSMN